jgi:hypothetical protein
MSIIEGGVFLIVGSLGTMRVLVATRMPPSGISESNFTEKELESSVELDKDIPLLSISSRPKHIALDNVTAMGLQTASYDSYFGSKVT